MRISWNWLSEFVDLSILKGPRELADLLTARGLEVEALESLSAGFEKVVTAKILERIPHPQADRLSVCKVDRGSGEPLEIVCGAQNMKAGDVVALAQVGALLPNGIKIAQSKIRGVVSNGMLCSEEELKLKDRSEGILILPSGTPLGQPLAPILGRDDTVLLLKLTANRGDCLSHLGIAREVAAALKQSLRLPKVTELQIGNCPAQTMLNAGDQAPQFWGCWIEGVKVGPSPDWMSKRLEAIGVRSINNVVDASNWVLYELGQPTHAYDADRLSPADDKTIKMEVRLAQKGERLPLLDGQEVILAGSELVIADGKKAVALAGVMGGGNSEVRSSTSRVFLECAEFSPVLVRRSAFLHQRRTEAAQRFEKGIDPAGLHFALSRLAQLITQIAGGKIIGSVASQSAERIGKKITVPEDYFSKFLGINLSQSQAKEILSGLGCRFESDLGVWHIEPPSYRLDLAIKEDLAEEIARSIGYNVIPSTLPALTSFPSIASASDQALEQELIERAKDSLVKQGLAEALQFAFNSKSALSKMGIDVEAPTLARILNPLSEEHEVLIPSLLPGLVQAAVGNWNRHFGSEALALRFFELRPTFRLSAEQVNQYQTHRSIGVLSETETGIIETWRLALLLSGPRFASGLRQDLGEVDFYDLKAALEWLFEELGCKGVRMRPMRLTQSHGQSQGQLPNQARSQSQDSFSMTVPFQWLHPGQTVEILAGKEVVGAFGLAHPVLSRQFKFRTPVWMGEMDWSALAKLSRTAAKGRAFKARSEFPTIERDFALVIRSEVTADQVTQIAVKNGHPLAKVVKVFDIYKGPQVAEGMTSIAVRVIFSVEGRSLREEEADQASSKILAQWQKELGAELRS